MGIGVRLRKLKTIKRSTKLVEIALKVKVEQARINSVEKPLSRNAHRSTSYFPALE